MNLFKLPYSAGTFSLTLDGAKNSAYIRSVDGGFVKASVIDEPVGPENLRIKHTSIAEVEPFSFEVGFAGSRGVLEWIQASWRKQYSRKSGDLTHGDFNHKGVARHQFTGALITETTFPALDGGSRESAYLKFKMLPETVDYLPDTNPVGGLMESQQKDWQANAFRLVIDGVPTPAVQKIESFTVKQGVKRLYNGRSRFPEIEPTKVEFPNIIATTAEVNAGPVLDWYKRFVVKGAPDRSQERSGAIEFLGPDKRTVLMRVVLHEVGLCAANVVGSQAQAGAIKQVRFELYVGRMDLDLSGTGIA